MTNENDIYESEIVLSESLPESDSLPALSYALIKKEIVDEEWGIRQSFTLLCECGGEIAVLSDITSIRERAEEIFRLFVKNTVTPTSAFYVIEEMI